MLNIAAWFKRGAAAWVSALLLSTQVFSQAIDEVVLVVDDQAVTAREFSVLHLIHDPSKPYAMVTPKLGEPVTDAIVDELLLAVHAKRLAPDAKIEDAKVTAAIDTLARQNQLTPEQLLDRLKSQGVDIQVFRESQRQRILVREVVAQRVARSIIVSSSEVREYINNRPELKGQTQKKYHASHLVIPIAEDLSKKEIKMLRKLAETARTSLLAGDAFAKVIADIDQAQSSSKDGDLGWKKQKELPELFVSALDKLEVGELSPVIESGNGFHLLALVALESSGGLPKEYQARHILKRLAPDADAKKLIKVLENLKQQILAGVDFASAARAESEDPGTSAQGGDLGWIKAAQVDPYFAQAMMALKVGEISDPIRTKFGLHLVQLLETRDQAGAATLEARVQQRIFAEKVDEKMQDLLNDIKQIALIEVVSQ